jgi:hypothetical protein
VEPRKAHGWAMLCPEQRLSRRDRPNLPCELLLLPHRGSVLCWVSEPGMLPGAVVAPAPPVGP